MPERGSVGASGDLAPLAHLCLPLIGEGAVRIGGETLPAAEGLRRTGLAPLTLAPKEGLALINGTQVSAALALVNFIRAERLLRAALVVGALTVEVGSRQARVGQKAIELTGLEFDLLVALMRRPGQVVPRTRLLELSGRSDTLVNDRTVDVHISHLRKKLGDDPPTLIKTVRGVGYVLSRE